MIGICTYELFEQTGILATQWDSRQPQVQKSTKAKQRFDDLN